MNILTDPKSAWVLVATSTSTSVSYILDMIPDDIGKIAVLLSIPISLILIRNHLRSGAKLKIELEILREERARQLKADAAGIQE